jgi:hypothetical protein
VNTVTIHIWTKSLMILDPTSIVPFSQNQTLIAVRAPQGTTLEVPDPNQVRFVFTFKIKFVKLFCKSMLNFRKFVFKYRTLIVHRGDTDLFLEAVQVQ